ncbi:hypothetical protein KIN20_013790, partial [Parelaphostrongylus tenuis]
MEETLSKLQEQYIDYQSGNDDFFFGRRGRCRHILLPILDYERVVEENSNLKRKVTRMEKLIQHQRIVIRDFENRLQVSQRSRSSTDKQAIAGSSSLLQKDANDYLDLNSGQNTSKNSSCARQLSKPTRPPPPPPLPKNPSLIRSHLKQNRIRVEVPFVATKSLINFAVPISKPVLEYPMECHGAKYAHDTDLALQINTEPSDFPLTRKVQGVVKYCAVNGRRPEAVKVYCYLESATEMFRWSSSTPYSFAASPKIKFDIIFSKEQQIAPYDRVVVFASAIIEGEMLVTNPVLLNLGHQAQSTINRPDFHKRQALVGPIATENLSQSAVSSTSTYSHAAESHYE